MPKQNKHNKTQILNSHMALNSCLNMSAYGAGVPVESRLLPSLVQLMLQGPQQQPAGATAFGSDGSSSARQQQLLQWRQLRQARLLEVHEQLAELPHALETLA